MITQNCISWPVFLALGWSTIGLSPSSFSADETTAISQADASALNARLATGSAELSYPALPLSGTACTDAFPGIVAWYQAEGNARDYVDSHDGVLTNGIGFGAGRYGQAFSLDGTNDYVATQLDVSPAGMEVTTWEAWIYPTRLNHTTRQQILSDDNGGYDRSLLIEARSTNFCVFTGNGIWMPTNASPNQWQHVAVVFALDHIDFYKNGERFLLNSAPGFGTTLNKLQIGRNPGYGEYFQGLIDDVAIYRRALSPDEVQALYQNGGTVRCGTKPFREAGLLTIQRDRDRIEIMWPVQSWDQVLQTSDVSGPSAIWVTESTRPVLETGYFSVTLSPGVSNKQAYYRLKGSLGN
jgi:hypothetical protein